MKKLLVITVAAIALAGCSQYSQTDRALVGGAVGAGTGALIGSAVGGSAGATVAGAVIGGAAGAMIGAGTTPNACYARDSQGRRYRVPCR